MDLKRKPWDEVQPYKKHFPDRVTAILFARKLARLYKAEVMLTEGKDPFKLSGAYFRNTEHE